MALFIPLSLKRWVKALWHAAMSKRMLPPTFRPGEPPLGSPIVDRPGRDGERARDAFLVAPRWLARDSEDRLGQLGLWAEDARAWSFRKMVTSILAAFAAGASWAEWLASLGFEELANGVELDQPLPARCAINRRDSCAFNQAQIQQPVSQPFSNPKKGGEDLRFHPIRVQAVFGVSSSSNHIQSPSPVNLYPLREKGLRNTC